MRPFVGHGVMLGVEDHLGDAHAISQVDENQSPVVSAALDPAHEDNGLSNIGCPKAVAVMALFPIPQSIEEVALAGRRFRLNF
jgi:hypothetical protein